MKNKYPNTKVLVAVLGALVVLDLALTIWGFLFPEGWYRFFHGVAYIDPQGLLRRCAGNWLAFFIIQTVAYVRWRNAPWWLVVVAGCRLGDSLTDVTCLIFSSNISLMGKLAFPLAGIGNIIAGIFLIKCFIRLTDVKR